MEKCASIPFSQIKKIEIYQNKSRLYMHQIVEQTGADYIINGTIYDVNKFKPYGNVKIDGQVIKNPQYKEYGMGSGPIKQYNKVFGKRHDLIMPLFRS